MVIFHYFDSDLIDKMILSYGCGSVTGREHIKLAGLVKMVM